MAQTTVRRTLPRGSFKLGLLLWIGVTLASGAAAGWLDNRWGRPADLAAAGENLSKTPEKFGDWVLEHSQSLDEDAAELLQASGSTLRNYRNQSTGDAVTVALIVGPAGPMSVHHPEVCYSSRDFNTLAPAKRFHVVGAVDAEFWGMTLEHAGLDGGKLSVAYGWNDGRGWAAPQQPRIQFGGAPLLYKLQLAAPLGGNERFDKSDPCRMFLRDFLPALDAVLLRASPAQNALRSELSAGAEKP
jgi:hypothetical protein